MKNIKTLILICLLGCVVTTVSAQTYPFRFGVKAGLNLSTAEVDDAADSKFRAGYNVGVTVDYLLPRNFMIQSGLLFTAKGSKQEKLNGSDWIPSSPDMTHTFNQLYLEIPVYAAYKIGVSRDMGIVVGAGPYVAYGLGGKTKQKFHNTTSSDSEYKWDTFGDGIYDDDRDHLRGETLNRFDFGGNIKVDLEYYKYVWGVGVSSSIINIRNKDNTYEDMKYRNFNIDISLGYKF